VKCEPEKHLKGAVFRVFDAVQFGESEFSEQLAPFSRNFIALITVLP
jgi:hypothetical protein